MPVGLLPNSVPSDGVDRLTLAAAIWPGDSSHGTPSDIVVVHEAVTLRQLPSLAAGELGDVRCALPIALPPLARRRVVAALNSLGGVSVARALDAPIAAFAHSLRRLSNSVPLTDRAPTLHVVAIAEPDGAASVIVGDTISHQLLTIGRVADQADATAIMTRAQGPPKRANTGWSHRRARTVRSMVGYGLKPYTAALLSETFDCPLVETSDSASDAVLAGLAQLSLLKEWSALWPTTRLHLGPGWTRQAGPLRYDIEEYSAPLQPGAAIRFSDEAGAPIPVVAGSVCAGGFVIPDRLRNHTTLRLTDDGGLVVFGPNGTRPLAVTLRWPIPGSGNGVLRIKAAKGSTVELLGPEFVSSAVGPTEIDHIEPQLSGQA